MNAMLSFPRGLPSTAARHLRLALRRQSRVRAVEWTRPGNVLNPLVRREMMEDGEERLDLGICADRVCKLLQRERLARMGFEMVDGLGLELQHGARGLLPRFDAGLMVRVDVDLLGLQPHGTFK